MADLLLEQMPPGIEMRDDREARAIGKALKKAAASIDLVSIALKTTRPLEAMKAAHALTITLRSTQDPVAEHTRPFEALSGKVVAGFGQFALQEPLSKEHLAANLWLQLAMIRWYLDRSETLPAAVLAREWVVSVLTVNFGGDLLDYKGARMDVEQALHNAANLKMKPPWRSSPSRFDGQLAALPQFDELISLWSQLREIRNDLSHAGMRPEARPAKRLAAAIESTYPGLRKLAENLLPRSADPRRGGEVL